MKNLINAITKEQKANLENFIIAINAHKELKELDTWQYRALLPKGKDVSNFSFNALKGYLIMRKEKDIYISIEKNVAHINTVMSSDKLVSVKINIEWKRSRTWGSNPKAEAWCVYKDADGNTSSHYAQSGSIGGCGYDKQSTAVAEVLNQFNEVLKPLYTVKNKNIEKKNHDLFGYGSGYGILPRIESGVGVSCYPAIFEKIGYKFNTVSSGKSFDVYEITKL